MPRTHQRSPAIRTTLVVLGFVLMAVAPVLGVLPGPGGIFVFAGGLVLVLRNATWARRKFARLKRRYPRLGRYCDMALRRTSFRRRERRRREALAAQEAH
ncbi:PGPGW domain-containing protein [Sphingomonas sp. S2-65]|uniref:PGPGW domain-containing protein n=1 Tax=Sphingomonas sp. S2-65 TaxID=2903960 RepID=UPI001F465FC3|nr:PGPGW domain-containing protein [Sphingomonas sp. S2-65]UYY58563.1 PGPGW domain-containing protein [Sphingomonas sp. S2-65]